MLRSTTCSDLLFSLLACSSEKLKIISVLLLVVKTPAAVDHCHYCLVFLTDSLPSLASLRLDSLAPESTRDLTRRVLDCLPFFPAGITSLKKIIGLKCTCFIFLLDLVWLSFLDGFCRLFNRWSSFNALSRLLELSFCYLIFDLLLSNLLVINSSLQPLFQISSSVSIELLLISSLLPKSES